ncbi:MAG TPA: carboxypeptidase regulatory-like domain-containing protein [Terriglobales bacterium]|nr:carboxypeptidase regulatory-like domain-containing protein [Terriglobales bacterium]
MKLLCKSLTLLLLIGLFSPLAFSQAGQGSISGVVKDQTGAVVANAKVTLTDKETQLTRTATTNSGGEYSFAALRPSTYTLSVAASGFATSEQQVVVSVGSKNETNVQLGVSGAGSVVEVTGEGATQVNTVDQEVSTLITSKEVVDLPTLTRNPYALVATASNVQQDSQAGMGDARGAGFAINGQRSASTSILLDGAENVDQFSATVGQQIPLDSMQEFRVVTNGMTAEYGRGAGGVVNVATKSGTNQFHGTAYEFNRISALASNTYNNAANNITKPVFTRNQFGGSIGGPIIKNKLFFFDNAEWIRVRSEGAQLTQVLDPAFLPYTAPATQAFYAAYGKLRPDLKMLGTMTSSQLGFTPGPLLSAVPAGVPVVDLVTYNTPSDSGGGNPENTVMNLARVDFNISDKTQLFGRYSLYKENDFPGVVNTSPFAGFETGQTFMDQNVMLSVTHTFTNSIVSNSRLIWSRLNNVQPLGTAPVGPTLYLTNRVTPRVNGNLFAQPGYNAYTPGSAIPFGGPQNLAQIYEDVSVAHGTHTFRFGGQYIYTQDNRAFGAYEESVQALSGTSDTAAFENLMTGTLSSFQGAVYPQGKYPCPYDYTAGAAIKGPDCQVSLPVGPPSFSRSNLYNDFALYGQDTWKVTPRLTLDLGLRWEYYGVQHNRNPQLDSNFYYGTGNDIFDQIRTGFVALAPNSPVGGLWKPRYGNLGPRFGFAYDVFGDGKLALRGGYGISYERDFNNVTYNVIQNPPNYAVLAITPAITGGPIPISTDNAGPLAGNTGSAYLGATSLRNVSDNIKTAYVEQYNLSLERQVLGNAVLSLAYNGARGIHQYGISNYNDPGYAPLYLGDTTNLFLNGQYSAINNRGSIGDSWYNGMVLGLRGRVHDIQLNASYTYSHSIDDLSSTFSDEVQNNGLGYLDPFNVGIDKGSSDYDARHRFTFSAVYDLPFGKNSSSTLVKQTIGGWQVAPIFNYHTGYPYTVFDCSNSGAFYNCPRADVSGAYNPKGGSTAGGDTGGNIFNWQTFPVAQAQYAGPTVIPGTNTPFPYVSSTLPTCTGLYGQGCTYPANMLHRNSMVGPGWYNWDMGVYKNFKLTERYALQFRAEFYDVINHKNFYLLGFGQGGADCSTSTSATACTIQAKKGGYGNPFDDHRNTQLAVKFIF